MKWDQVMAWWLERLTGDAELIATLGGEHLYPAGANRPVKVPSLEYLVVTESEGEWLNPMTIQWDYWARGMQQAKTIERRLRLISHRDTSVAMGSERLWLRLIDTRELEYTAEKGVVHRALDFLAEPVRSKYTTGV